MIAIKAVHTLVWAFFVARIAAIWMGALRGDLPNAAIAMGLVFIEVVVLAVNKGRCALSAVAGRLTDERRANFDIDLPRRLAGGTMPIFGTF